MSPCALPLSARAGDKIEFSAASALLEVPRAEGQDKESPKAGLPEPMPARALLSQEDEEVPQEVVIISTPRRMAAKTRDSAKTDNGYDNLDSKPRSSSGAINPWDMPDAWNSDDRNKMFEKRRDRDASHDSLRARFEAVNTTGSSDYQRDDRYGGRSADSDQSSTLPRSFFHYETSSLPRMQEGPFAPFYEEMKALNEQSSQGHSSAQVSNPLNDLSQEAKPFPGAAAYATPWDVAHARTPEETMNAPRAIHPVDTKPVTQNSDVFERQQPPPSPRGQVQSRPAILPFPKKPGDVLY